MQWACDVFGDLLYRCWEDEYFLFNPHTGQTHILNEFSWRILSVCAERPCSESFLSNLMSPGTDTMEAGDQIEALGVHLDHLRQLGMLSPVEDHAPD